MHIPKVDCSKYSCALKEVIQAAQDCRMSKVEQHKLSTLANDIVQISDTKRVGRNIGQIYEKVIDKTTGKIVKKQLMLRLKLRTENLGIKQYTISNIITKKSGM